MAKSIKNIIATLFLVILLCKSVLTLVATFSQHKHIDVISAVDPAESENPEQEGKQKSSERMLAHEDFADVVLPVIISNQKFLVCQHLESGVYPLTHLAVFTPPPERA